METLTLGKFYKDISSLVPDGINKELGHFNVFKLDEILARIKDTKSGMPYNRRTYYKISLISGRNRAEYADKVIDIEKNALLFATPKIPYNWLPQDDLQSGYFCIFTGDFLTKNKGGVTLDDLPIYQPAGYPIFQLSDEESEDIAFIFRKMLKELTADYAYKYDLLRNYVLELIHYGQKLQPASVAHPEHNASARVTSLFIELLERQFPIESLHQTLSLRTARDYADRLAIHVNYLNRVLKHNTGNTTTEIISHRIIQEAKILLKQTDWSISEIAYSLGFEELAYFSNFFRKQTSLAPLAFRG